MSCTFPNVICSLDVSLFQLVKRPNAPTDTHLWSEQPAIPPVVEAPTVL
jgi:hypothetical protein